MRHEKIYLSCNFKGNEKRIEIVFTADPLVGKFNV